MSWEVGGFWDWLKNLAPRKTPMVMPNPTKKIPPKIQKDQRWVDGLIEGGSVDSGDIGEIGDTELSIFV